MADKIDEIIDTPVVVEEELPEVVVEEIAPPDPMANFSQFQADVMQALDELRNAVAELQDDEAEEAEEAEPEAEEAAPEETVIETVKVETPEAPKPVERRGRVF
jgi:demethoxyubiquinone hydroxylase (CLK1/Coq7/Cat5 family)